MKTIECTITRPGYNPAGLRVVAYQEKSMVAKKATRIGRHSSRVIAQLGNAMTNDDGKCKIKLSIPANGQNESGEKSKVFIRVYEGEIQLGESSKINMDDVLNFVYEIGFPEKSNLTVVTVTLENGDPAMGAEVFWKGLSRGKTDSMGHFILTDVKTGDKIAARLLLHENRTSRQNHDQLSGHNWNYRVYITSVQILHDANGDNIVVPLHIVSDPEEEQVIRLSRNNTQVGFNLLVSFEWDATTEELIYYRDRMFEMSELLYNATDGQFLIEHFVIADDKAYWESADYRIYASNNQDSLADLNAFYESSGCIYMNPIDAQVPGALLHELSHYALGLGDEHGANGCTYEGLHGTNTVFSLGGEKEACIARGDAMQFRSLKICSSHPDNPHVTTTEQGDQDCWTTISNRFNNDSRWRIHTSQSRNAIVGRLPDSGVPIARWTTREPWETEAKSYIPVFGWKPQWHFEDAWLEDECHNFKIRVLYYGETEDKAHVAIQNHSGRTIVQGTTRSTDYLYRDGLTQNQGELIIRGAHKGDTITISSRRLLIIDTIQVSGSNLTLELNFEGWDGGVF